MDKNPKFLIIVGIIISLLVIGGIGFWYWSFLQEYCFLGGMYLIDICYHQYSLFVSF